MNILQINSYDTRGGAARVAYDLYKGLRSREHVSKMMVGRKLSDHSEIETIRFDSSPSIFRIYDLMREVINKCGESFGLQYFINTSAGYLLRSRLVREADIVHLHNTHGGYLNLWAVEGLAREKPVVWTLHDMWGFTGHCSYSVDCDRWKTGCGDCPDLRIYPQISLDTTRLLWKIKSGIYRKSRIVLVVPSRWLKDMLPESMLSHFPVHLIYNGVDTDIFQPKDREAVRSALGLPRDRFILTFAAEMGPANRLKGFNYLMKALDNIRPQYRSSIYLLVVGRKGDFTPETAGLEGKCVGLINDMNQMASYYAASDAFLIPSIADNCPLVVLESMACGTPVVGFDAGGIPELVRHEETGYIAKSRDAEEFAKGIERLMGLDKAQYKEMRSRCVAVIHERHTLKDQVQKYLDLYETIKEE